MTEPTASPEPIDPAAGTTHPASDDPLGYDMTDFDAAVGQMIADVKSGRTKAAVQAELARVRLAYKRGSR